MSQSLGFLGAGPRPLAGAGNEWSTTHDGAEFLPAESWVIASVEVFNPGEWCMRLDHIERALAVRPRDPELWLELAKASWSAHDLETAQGAWELAQGLARRPHPAE